MIYDVTVPITNSMPVWPSDPPVKLAAKTHVSPDGTEIRITAIEMGSHTGTHIDAPWHFVQGGRRLSDIPLECLVGPATVIEVSGARSVSRSHLERFDFEGVERLLLKTDNSQHWRDGKFFENFVYLDPGAAELLIQSQIRLVGIDYLSIDPFKSDNHPTHFALLEKNVVILEGLDLSRVPPGRYEMAALPLNLLGADGAPTRVILMDEGKRG
jgi:arylformamidase